MNAYLIHVTPMQHVTTQLVALPVLVSVVILEMAFYAQVRSDVCRNVAFINCLNRY